MQRPFALIGVGTLLAVGAVFAADAAKPGRFASPGTMQVPDFGAYWVGAKLNLAGRDPYSEANLLPLQREIEPGLAEAFPLWSPPWVFALLAPLAPLDFSLARWIWRFLQIATLLASATALWRTYRGKQESIIWAWFAALAWYPTLQMLGIGQFSNLVLLGLAGWTAGLAAGRRFTAGMFLTLTLVKPQNLYLFGLLAVVWIVHRRQWRVAAGAAAGTLILSAIIGIPNPGIFEQYLNTFRTRSVGHFLPPTLGMHLRLLFGEEHFWLSFLPPLFGLAWAARHYWRNRREWSWPEQGPLVVLVSCATSPYGWIYDQVVFVLPMMALLAAASRHPAGLSRGVMAVVGLATLCLLLHSAGCKEVTFVWLAPTCLITYLLFGKRLFRNETTISNGV
jgi:hypothetical protein